MVQLVDLQLTVDRSTALAAISQVGLLNVNWRDNGSSSQKKEKRKKKKERRRERGGGRRKGEGGKEERKGDSIFNIVKGELLTVSIVQVMIV